MNTSEQINEIAMALAKAQGEMENATKNAKNPHFKNEYADLAEVLATVRPVLSKHGIAIAQMTGIEGNAMVLHTRLIHTSGQWLESVHPIAQLPERPQVIGANETYARRYSLAAMCGIGQADDDLGDGKNAAQAAAPPRKQGKEQENINVEYSASIHDMLIGAAHEAKNVQELDEWRELSSTKAAAKKLTPEHLASVKDAVVTRRSDLQALAMEPAQ